MVACLLIGVAATARIAAKITSVSLMGGLIACGVILLLIAIVGLVGATRHHQVFLFFVSFKGSLGAFLLFHVRARGLSCESDNSDVLLCLKLLSLLVIYL